MVQCAPRFNVPHPPLHVHAEVSAKRSQVTSFGLQMAAFRSLLLQETIKRGVLMPSLVVSYAHSDADIDYTIAAIDDALGIYGKALERGVERYLVGPPSQVVYRRFN